MIVPDSDTRGATTDDGVHSVPYALDHLVPQLCAALLAGLRARALFRAPPAALSLLSSPRPRIGHAGEMQVHTSLCMDKVLTVTLRRS